LIAAVVQDMNMLQEENFYSTGSIAEHHAEKVAETYSLFRPEQRALTFYPVNNWQDKMQLKTEVNFKSKEIEAGLIIHEALAFISTESDVETASVKIKNIYNLLTAETDILKKELMQIMDRCRPLQWFTGNYTVFSERDFVNGDGKLLRPDRIMLKDKTAIIVDYKTGEEAPSHIKQADEYAGLLNESGYQVVECWLFYTSSGKMLNTMNKSGRQGVLPI
ncbi:MAG: hypothetical protein ABI772_15720, partial [Bacteroidota bacterium]